MKDIKKAINSYITILNEDSKMHLADEEEVDDSVYEEAREFNKMIQLKQLSFVDDDATPDEVIRIMNALNSVDCLLSPQGVGGGSDFIGEFRGALRGEIAKKHGYEPTDEGMISMVLYCNVTLDYYKKLYALLNSAKKMNKDYFMLKMQIDTDFLTFT